MSKRLKIAGILNVTPDSFSDGGRFKSIDEAADSALAMYRSGVDIIDIGGESTRPGAEPVPLQEELKRTIPVIEAILREDPLPVISIDTYKGLVAEAAITAGANIVNDISGGTFDSYIWEVVARYQPQYIIMHTTGRPVEMQQKTEYSDVVEEVLGWLLERAEAAERAGIKNIILDPGIGFGKTPRQNVELLAGIKKFTDYGYPVMVGLSRKSFMGKLFGHETSESDIPGSYYEFYTALQGVDVIRTHNTKNALIYRQILESLNV